MRKGAYIQIKENGKYSGQDMNWTERKTSSKIIDSEVKVYHYSDTKLNVFRAKTTCFFDTKKSVEGHVYELTIPVGTYVEYYDDEVRINLTENMKIRYIGQIIVNRDYKVNGRPGNPFITINDNTINGNGKTVVGLKYKN